MVCISTTLLALLQPSNVVLHPEPVYGGYDFFLRNVLRRFGIEAVSFRPTDTPAQLAARAAAIAPVRLASKSIMREIKTIRTFMGTMYDPNTGWMLTRNLATLKLRMKRAAQPAQTIADWLRQHSLVART